MKNGRRKKDKTKWGNLVHPSTTIQDLAFFFENKAERSYVKRF